MTKAVALVAKVHAYEDAIAFLQSFESEADGPGDKEGRDWLIKKLDRDCNRLIYAVEDKKKLI